MITVIVPCWEREEELRQALLSLAAQTMQEFKVLVSDDHSTNDMKAVCDEFKDLLNIDFIRTHRNMGCGGNRKFALETFYQNPTEYMMFMDSDDALVPQAIMRLSKAIEEDEADIISTDIIQETSQPIQSTIKAKNSKTWLHGKMYRTQFLIDNKITFPQDLKTNEDLAFNLAVFQCEPISYLLNEQLYLWRYKENSITRSKESKLAQWKCNSIDFIDAVYFAYGYNTKKLTNQLICDIIACYNYWQNAIVYGTLEERYRAKIRKMLHHQQVMEVIIRIYNYPHMDFKLKQWCKKDDELIFFGQTFGQWLMMFFKPEEIKELIRKHQLIEDKETGDMTTPEGEICHKTVMKMNSYIREEEESLEEMTDEDQEE